MEASVNAFVEDFVEATSMEAFVKASMEASGGGFHESLYILRGTFHGSFHELPRKNQVVQETGRSELWGKRSGKRGTPLAVDHPQAAV